MSDACGRGFALIGDASGGSVLEQGLEPKAREHPHATGAAQGQFEVRAAGETTGRYSAASNVIHHTQLQVGSIDDAFLRSEVTQLEVTAQPKKASVMRVDYGGGGSDLLLVAFHPLMQIGE